MISIVYWYGQQKKNSKKRILLLTSTVCEVQLSFERNCTGKCPGRFCGEYFFEGRLGNFLRGNNRKNYLIGKCPEVCLRGNYLRVEFSRTSSGQRRSQGCTGCTCTPRAEKKFWAKFTGESCKCTPRESVHPHAEQESSFYEEIAQIWTVLACVFDGDD